MAQSSDHTALPNISVWRIAIWIYSRFWIYLFFLYFGYNRHNQYNCVLICVVPYTCFTFIWRRARVQQHTNIFKRWHFNTRERRTQYRFRPKNQAHQKLQRFIWCKQKRNKRQRVMNNNEHKSTDVTQWNVCNIRWSIEGSCWKFYDLFYHSPFKTESQPI